MLNVVFMMISEIPYFVRTMICSSELLFKASSKHLTLSFRLSFWNVRVSTWSWANKQMQHKTQHHESKFPHIHKYVVLFFQSTIPVEKAVVSESPPLGDFFVARELSSSLLRDAGEQQTSLFNFQQCPHSNFVFKAKFITIPLMVRVCSSCSVSMVILCMSLSSSMAAWWLTVISSI